jgi:hypothetical protein
LAAVAGDSGSAEQFGVVAEPAQPVRIPLADRVEEGVDQFGVEVAGTGAVDRRPVEQRRPTGGQEALLLHSREPEIPVVPAQVGGTRRRDAAGFDREIALVHPCHHDGFTVDDRIGDRESYRGRVRPGLGCQALLQRLRVAEPDRPEPGLLVQAKDDRSSTGQVRQRTHRRG